MTIKKSSVHLLGMIVLAGTTQVSFAAGPFEAKKVIESGQSTPQGTKILGVSSFARSNTATAFVVDTTPAGALVPQHQVYIGDQEGKGIKSVFKSGELVYSEPGSYYYRATPAGLKMGQGAFTFSTSIEWYGYTPYRWGGGRVLTDMNLSGGILGSYSTYSYGSPSGFSYTSLQHLGFMHDKAVIREYGYGDGGGNSSETVEIRHNGKVLASGGYYSSYNDNLYIYYGSAHGSIADHSTQSILLNLYKPNSIAPYIYKYKDGNLTPFAPRESVLANGMKVSTPLGLFRDGMVSGVAYGFFDNRSFRAVVSTDASGSNVVWEPSLEIAGLTLGNGATIEAEVVAHNKGRLIWMGSISKPNHFARDNAIVEYRDGVNHLLYGVGSELFGSTIIDLRLNEDSIEDSDFYFWYKLADGRTGVAAIQSVPEPGTLVALGLGALLLRRRKR